MIELRDAGRRYGEVVALDAVTLSVGAGEAVALMGPNGAGKSTLLRAVAGLTRLTEGEATVNGAPARRAHRRRVGLLAHESYLYGSMSARENLEFVAKLHGANPARIDAVLEQVGMTWAADSTVDTFSRGMEQRIAVARVLLTEPSLVLLDEPFSGLDAKACSFVTDELRSLHAAGTTLVIVTHDPVRAARIIDRAVVLVRGRLTADFPVTDADRDGFPSRYHALVGVA